MWAAEYCILSAKKIIQLPSLVLYSREKNFIRSMFLNENSKLTSALGPLKNPLSEILRCRTFFCGRDGLLRNTIMN